MTQSTRQYLITPDDDEVIDPVYNAIRVEGTGDLSVVLSGNTDAEVQTWSIAGMELIDEVVIKKVMATNTDAGNLKIIGMR